MNDIHLVARLVPAIFAVAAIAVSVLVPVWAAGRVDRNADAFNHGAV